LFGLWGRRKWKGSWGGKRKGAGCILRVGKGGVLGKRGKKFTVIQEIVLFRGEEFDGRGVLLVSHLKNVFEDFLRVINPQKISDPGKL
jgi:hypothetical protein